MSMVTLMETVGLQVALKAIALPVIDTVFCVMRTSWAFPLLNSLGSSWNTFWHTDTHIQVHVWKGRCRYPHANKNKVIMYTVHEFKSTYTRRHEQSRTYACTQAMALDPLAKIIWGEPHKCLRSLKSKVTNPGRHMDSKIPLITASNKSSPP